MRRVFLFCCFLSVLAPAAFAAKDDVYAIVGARLLPVSGPAIESGTVILRDGLIEAVGASVALPADARVIDAKGWTLSPGLIDAFSGVGLPSDSPKKVGESPRRGSRRAGSEGENALTPEARALDALSPSEALKARDAGVTTALVIRPDGILPGQSVLIDLVGETTAGMVLEQPAAMHLHMATRRVGYPDSLMGTVAYVRQQLYDAARYDQLWTSYEKEPRGRKRPTYDAGLAAWRDVLAGRKRLIVTARRENDIRRALALADEFKIQVAVAGAPQASRLAALIKARGLPLIVGVNFDPAREVSFFGGDDDNRERRQIAEAERNPGELTRAGVAFALGSDHAPSFADGLQRAIEKGLPREAALRATTLGAAEVLGIADRTGSLEPGKLANLVAWKGEPLAKDVKIAMVFVDGKLYEPEAKEKSKADAKPDADKDSKRKPEAKAGDAPARKLPPEPMAAPRPSPAPADAAIAIVGGTILTAGPQGTLEKATLLIRGGKIAALGANLDLPPGTRVIDASGRYLTPGLIDCHSHTAIEQNVNECSDSVTAEVRIADVLDHDDVALYRELAGGVTAANVLHGSCNAIGGQNAVIKLRWGQPPEKLLFEGAPRGVKFALGENPKRSNFKLGEDRYPATRMGVEETIRQAFEDARAYRREWAEYDRRRQAGENPPPPRTDLRKQELADILDGKVLVHAHSYRSDEILMLIQLADEFGFKIRTFQHVLEGYKVASEIARHGAGASTFADFWAYKLEAYDAIPYNAAIMAAHGIPVSLNSDSDELARRLYWEAAKAVKYGGVSEDEALKMVTLNPAWQLGVDGRVGSLEVGKDADIAVFSAHPFAPDARVEMTLIDGTVYFDRSRDLAARAATAKAGGE